MKTTATIMILVFALLCFAGSALAAESLKFSGQPTMFSPGKSTGYFIWQDSDGLHFRSTSDQKHVFSGVIQTNGHFENVFTKLTEKDDYVHVNHARDEVNFTFTTAANEAGIDMSFKGGTYIKFDLSMDGEKVNPFDIFIGSEGWHPVDYKFTLRHKEDHQCDHDDDHTTIIIDGGFWWDWTPHHFHPGLGPAPNP